MVLVDYIARHHLYEVLAAMLDNTLEDLIMSEDEKGGGLFICRRLEHLHYHNTRILRADLDELLRVRRGRNLKTVSFSSSVVLMAGRRPARYPFDWSSIPGASCTAGTWRIDLEASSEEIARNRVRLIR